MPLTRKKNKHNPRPSNDFLTLTKLNTTVPARKPTHCAFQSTPPLPAMLPTSSTVLFSELTQAPDQPLEQQPVFLSDFLSPKFYQALQQAAHKGFLYSFIASLPAEFLSDYFKQARFSSTQIYLFNQLMRTLTIFSMTAYFGLLDNKSLCLILGAPLASFGLKSALGTGDLVSKVLPSSALIATELVKDQQNAFKLFLSLLTATSAGWLGATGARLGAHWLKTGFFSIKNKISPLNLNENDLDSYFAASKPS